MARCPDVIVPSTIAPSIMPQHFGLIIAYLLPGFIGLAGVVPLIPAVGRWIEPVATGEIGLGPTTYAVLVAITVGMIVSCVRYLVVDTFHHVTGIRPATWHLGQLEGRLDAFKFIVEGNYRYHQFYANTLVAVVWSYMVNRLMNTSSLLGFGTDAGVLVLCAILLAGSRDALRKYYLHASQVVGLVAEKGE